MAIKEITPIPPMIPRINLSFDGICIELIYLLLNGIERFFIEKIRVNTKYHISGHAITQAEIISSALILIGIGGIVYLNNRKNKIPSA